MTADETIRRKQESTKYNKTSECQDVLGDTENSQYLFRGSRYSEIRFTINYILWDSDINPGIGMFRVFGGSVFGSSTVYPYMGRGQYGSIEEVLLLFSYCTQSHS